MRRAEKFSATNVVLEASGSVFNTRSGETKYDAEVRFSLWLLKNAQVRLYGQF